MRNLLVIPLLLLMLCFKSYANNPSTASRISHVQFKEYSDEMERKTKSEVAHEIQRIKDALEYKTAKGKISRPVAFVLATTLSTLTYMLITGGVTHYFMHQGDDGSVNNGDPKPTKGDGSAKGGGSKPGLITLANLLSLITLANLLSLITLANLLSLLHLLILVKKVRTVQRVKAEAHLNQRIHNHQKIIRVMETTGQQQGLVLLLLMPANLKAITRHHQTLVLPAMGA